MAEEKNKICIVCNEDGKVKTGRVCPACNGEKHVTPTRHKEIMKGMKMVEEMNAGTGFFSQRGKISSSVE